MKKMLTCCATLCLALSLFCVSALAGDLEIQVSSLDESAVKVTRKADSAAPIFTVNKSSGAQSGQLYLVMIQQGSDASAKPVPTKENLYYLNVEEAAGASFTTEAYPRDMAEGDYIVYLSDYSGSAAGAAAGVAKITVSAKSSGGGSGGEGNVKYGDVNGDGDVKRNDRIILAHYLADVAQNKTDSEYGPGKKYNVVLANADVNADGNVLRNDRIILTRHIAGMAGYETLPYSAKK